MTERASEVGVMAAPQEESFSLPPPELIAEEISEDLRAALEQLEEIAADLSPEATPVQGLGE